MTLSPCLQIADYGLKICDLNLVVVDTVIVGSFKLKDKQDFDYSRSALHFPSSLLLRIGRGMAQRRALHGPLSTERPYSSSAHRRMNGTKACFFMVLFRRNATILLSTVSPFSFNASVRPISLLLLRQPIYLCLLYTSPSPRD
mgnify:CR=1 FL=1